MTLANEIVRQGGECHFACSEETNKRLIVEQGHTATSIGFVNNQLDDAERTQQALSKIPKVDLIIVDKYSLAELWEVRVKSNGSLIAVIVDLANRQHNCDLLLDQTLGRVRSDYGHLVSMDTALLLSTKYCLLRTEFANVPTLVADVVHRSDCFRLVISMGGTDPQNITESILDALNLNSWSVDLVVTVILGGQSPGLSRVLDKCKTLGFEVNCVIDAENLADILAGAHLAIGGAGTSAWERCAVGLPTLFIICADNQEMVAAQISKRGAAINLGRYEDLNMDTIAPMIIDLMQRPKKLIAMREFGLTICDGQGTKRVVKKLEEVLYLRKYR
jgi:UDP-2,4-diacetamido-2,4,6-trideoxy-beta-L-altropyranose hydrolase